MPAPQCNARGDGGACLSEARARPTLRASLERRRSLLQSLAHEPATPEAGRRLASARPAPPTAPAEASSHMRRSGCDTPSPRHANRGLAHASGCASERHRALSPRERLAVRDRPNPSGARTSCSARIPGPRERARRLAAVSRRVCVTSRIRAWRTCRTGPRSGRLDERSRHEMQHESRWIAR